MLRSIVTVSLMLAALAYNARSERDAFYNRRYRWVTITTTRKTGQRDVADFLTRDNGGHWYVTPAEWPPGEVPRFLEVNSVVTELLNNPTIYGAEGRAELQRYGMTIEPH